MDLATLQELPSWQWPRNAGRTLRDTLRDKKAAPEDRLAAARLLGDIVAIDNEGVDLLLSILKSDAEPQELRGKAAIALGPTLELADTADFDDPYDQMPISEAAFHKIQKTFRALYEQPGVSKFMRRRILEASVRAPEDWHEGAVREAYASSDEEWKLTSVFCMAYVRGFEREILESLNNPHEKIHYHAVTAAGNWGLDEAWPHVLELAVSEETEKNLRIAAIEALSGIRPREALSILDELIDSKDEEISAAAEEAYSMAQGAAEMAEDDEEEDDFDGEEEDFDDEDEEDDEDEDLEDEDEEEEDEDEEEERRRR